MSNGIHMCNDIQEAGDGFLMPVLSMQHPQP